MGKKRIAKKSWSGVDAELKARALGKLPKKKFEKGGVYIRATYNNTMVSFVDEKGNVLMWSSAGSMGFKGARKGTPYAASKVSELIADKAKQIGVRSIDIFIKGVGSGRESAIRSFVASGIGVDAIRDITPIPHNGPKAPKPRRV
ncbi:MAG: 30S ribosomal protein S11 [Candidatus Niyogibacteria bacterium]|nr:30S ribosomal protein S11 [Candidatus Niyogibacteria bacterium]